MTMADRELFWHSKKNELQFFDTCLLGGFNDSDFVYLKIIPIVFSTTGCVAKWCPQK
jgi:hypothetical protein